MSTVLVVIPAFEEARYVGATLDALFAQVDRSGAPIEPDRFRIVVVHRDSGDGTRDVVERAAAAHPAHRCEVVEQAEPGHTQARVIGIERGLTELDPADTVVASVDADTLCHPGWIDSILRHAEHTNVDLFSYAGHYPKELWDHAPRLKERYAAELGTLFFDPVTAAEALARGERALFTERLFFDFGRLPSDCGLAIRASAYRGAGGYRVEYDDDGNEVYGEGWHLRIRAEFAGYATAYVNDAPYATSARRFVAEPHLFLGGGSYDKQFVAHRDTIAAEQYRMLDELSPRFEFSATRDYVVRYYVLLNCVLRPELVLRNRNYFTGFADALYVDAARLARDDANRSVAAVLAASRRLCDTYGELVLRNAARA
jgi:glycosyltransferase involved in cell wall biosynthesis